MDSEADQIFALARQRLTLRSKLATTLVDEEAINRIGEAFRHRKLVADEARYRGARPMSSEEWEALVQQIAATEAGLRDANILAAGNAIMDWAVECRRLAINPFAEIRTPKEKKVVDSKRRGFTDEETVSLLTDARTWTGYRRWVPWLATFTGARLDELCQLEVFDVRDASGIRYIDINADGPGKSL